METAVRDYLAWALQDDRIVRPRLSGKRDVGDIANICFMGQHVCVECKNVKGKKYLAHAREAVMEAGNLDAPYWWVVQKKPGIGIGRRVNVGLQLAYTSVGVLHDMRVDAPDDRFLHNSWNFHSEPRYPMLVFTDLQSLAVILNHGVPLGEELES